MKNGEVFCRVCGYEYPADNPPWLDGESFHDICICCNAQFGYNDIPLEGIKDYREYWLKTTGGNWHDPKNAPPGWNLINQLSQVPERFR